MIKDSGSNYSFYDKVEKAKVGKSRFDESYINSFTCDEGILYPSYFEYTLPNDTWKLTQQSLIRVVNTPVVPLASRQRAFTHTYWCSLPQLWKYAEQFFPKGFTVNDYATFEKDTVPTITLDKDDVGRGSLADMLGFNFGKAPTGDVVLPAFKFMMYLRIMRDYYINKRIYKTWLDTESESSGDAYSLISAFMFPRDDADFRIGSEQWNAIFVPTGSSTTLSTAQKTAIHMLFAECWARDWTQDYFTTAQLTPQIAETSLDDVLSFSPKTIVPSDSATVKDTVITAKSTDSNFYIGESVSNIAVVSQFYTNRFADAMNNSLAITSDLTMDSLRNLACASAILEKLAKVDGSYREFGKAYFGVSSSMSKTFTPKYVGGTYAPIVFTDVINTGSSLGAIGGKGISGNSGNVGAFFSDDFGITMTLFSIMPDTYYTQGLHKQDLYLTSEDFYLPERSKLGMGAILNGEIFNDPTNPSMNSKVFGYQNRFDEYRYRYNECHGKVADPSSVSFHPFIEQRVFSSCPTLTPSFLNTKGTIDAKWKTSAQEVGYFVQILNGAFATRPLPYRAKENTMGF